LGPLRRPQAHDALDLAAKIGVPGRIDDVDLDGVSVLVRDADGSVLG